MQPENQLPTPSSHPLSADYLNAISTQPTVKTMNPFVLWGMIVGVLILIIVIVIGVSSASGSGTSTSSLASVGATLDNLQSTSEDAQKNLQSGELRSINSSLTLALTNTNRDIAAPLTAQKIKLSEPSKNSSVARVIAEFESLNERLEDARLNAIYDRTYAREMTFALKSLNSDMSVLYKSTRSAALKTTLNESDDNLSPLLKSFESFNGS